MAIVSYALAATPVWLPVGILAVMADPGVFHILVRQGDIVTLFLTTLTAVGPFVLAAITFLAVAKANEHVSLRVAVTWSCAVGLLGSTFCSQAAALIYVSVAVLLLASCIPGTGKVHERAKKRKWTSHYRGVCWATAGILAVAINVPTLIYLLTHRNPDSSPVRGGGVARILVGRMLYGLNENIIVVSDGKYLHGTDAYVVNVDPLSTTIITSYPEIVS